MYIITSVAMQLFGIEKGGGGQDPQMYRQKKKKKNLYARASEASERSERAPQKHIFLGLQIHLHVQSMQFPFITLAWRCI